MRRLSVTIALALGWLAVPADAFGCVCFSNDPAGPSPSEIANQVRRQLSEARAVFIGEPVAWNMLAFRFRVHSVWKGELGPEVVMSSGSEPTSDGLIRSSSCDFSFRVGQRYVVFAYGESHLQMKARACDLTSAMEHNPVAPGLLDQILQRRPPAPSVPSEQVVVVVGNVLRPGFVRWRPGITVAEAIELAGGSVPRVRDDFAGFKSRIMRGRAVWEDHEALPGTVLLPDDQLSVVGPPRVGTRILR